MLKPLIQQLLTAFFVMSRPLTVGARGICINTETNSILLVKHTYADGWSLPGGGTEVGESVLETLTRELLEETGLNCMSAKLVDVYHNSTISKRDHIVIYIVENWSQQPSHRRPKKEILEATWFNLNQLPKDLNACSIYGLQCLDGHISRRT